MAGAVLCQANFQFLRTAGAQAVHWRWIGAGREVALGSVVELEPDIQHA
jgi:hypothetical protein